MGLLSLIDTKIQQAKGRASIGNRLCGRSWRVITSDPSVVTYVFKSDGQLLITRDGFISPWRWDFRSENNKLLVFNENGEGIAFDINVIKENVLISLVQACTSQAMFLSNEEEPKAPKSIKEVDSLYISMFVDLIKTADLERKRRIPSDNMNYSNREEHFVRTVDTILNEVKGELLIAIIDKARLECERIAEEIENVTARLHRKEEREKEQKEREEAKIRREMAQKLQKTLREQGEDDSFLLWSLIDHEQLGRHSLREPSRQEMRSFYSYLDSQPYSSKVEEYVKLKGY